MSHVREQCPTRCAKNKERESYSCNLSQQSLRTAANQFGCAPNVSRMPAFPPCFSKRKYSFFNAIFTALYQRVPIYLCEQVLSDVLEVSHRIWESEAGRLDRGSKRSGSFVLFRTDLSPS